MQDTKLHELAEADYIGGMKYKEIAEKYGISINTVKSWKSRYNWCRKKGAHKNEKSMHTKNEKRCIQKNKKNDAKKEPVESEIEEIINDDELTDKQRLFCILYSRCFNATKAYQKAYKVKYETAAVNGHRMLRNAKVKKEIENLKQNRLNREMLSEEDIIQMYIDILYADITDFLDTEHNMIDLSNPLVDGRLIRKVTFGKSDSIELMSKEKALQWLADHMDLATKKQRLEIELLQQKINASGNGNDSNKDDTKNNMQFILDQIQPAEEKDTNE